MQKSKRKMTIHLTPGSIGVKASQTEIIDFAHYYGYESAEPIPAYLTTQTAEELKKLSTHLQSMQLVWGSAGLPVEFRLTEEQYAEGMKALPQHAKALQTAGVKRVGTWLRPTHDKLTFRQNFDQHVRRLGAVAKILEEHDLRFGMEYVGPKTSWSAMRYPFIHTMAEMKELIAAMGRKNTGFVLDSWHWYTAQETKDDLLTLKNSDVVSVDLNDAPLNIPVDRQMDLSRELPCATGVIDVAAFLNALQAIGYDGPVRPEPFNDVLRRMTREQALSASVEACRKAMELIV